MKLRKLPVEVEAWLWTGNLGDMFEWIMQSDVPTGQFDFELVDGDHLAFYVNKSGGAARIRPGDYVIVEDDCSGFYPLAADARYRLYEP